MDFFKKLFLCLLIASVITPVGYAATKMVFNPIPDSLKNNADAVIRFHNTSYEINNQNKLKGKVHFAITVLNRSGEKLANLMIHYDKSKKVDINEVICYNSSGQINKDVGKKNIHDVSNHGSYSFFSDSRTRYVSISSGKYPFTMEYEYEFEKDGFIHIDTWAPIYSTGLALERASLTIQSATEYTYKWKELNYSFAVKTNTLDNVDVTKWTINGVKAFEKVPLAPSGIERFPLVIVAPTNFIYEGYEGDMSTWESYGIWMNKLLDKRTEIPDEEVAQVKAMTDTLATDYAKAKCIYEYMQSKTRYISIALGIGGLQPMTAEEVSEVGYGDCKALSNYTRSLLDAVGIKAYYTEIGSGSAQKIRYPDFTTATQTNHVILTLPLDSDTLFLECTSQTIPFGYIGPSNSNRYALMNTSKGGKLIRTPVYHPEDNLRSRNATLSVYPNGSAICTTHAYYRCGQYDDNIAYLMRLSGEEQRKEILKDLELTEVSLNKYTVEENKSRFPSGSLNLDLSAQKYGSVLGNRLIFSVNPNFKAYNEIQKNDNRQVDIVRNFGYLDVDTIQINLPEGYKTEYVPSTFEQETPFGKYSCKTEKLSETELQHIRYLKMNEGHFDKSLYPELVEFYKSISESDNEKVVLKKL